MASEQVSNERLAEMQAGMEGVTPYGFDRYVNGKLMAEGVTVEHAASLEIAIQTAVKIASRGPKGATPVLVYRRDDGLGTVSAEGWKIDSAALGFSGYHYATGPGDLRIRTNDARLLGRILSCLTSIGVEAGGEDDQLQEIADGAWGDNPMVRGKARDMLAAPRASEPVQERQLTETMRAEVVYEGEDNSWLFKLSEVGNRDGVHYDRSIELSADTFPEGTVISIREPVTPETSS